MKICSLIHDILPLYIEGICSEDSKEMIKAHLSSCSICRREYQLMTKDVPIEPEKSVIPEIDPLAKIKKVNRNKTVLSVSLAAAAIALLIFIFIWAGYIRKDVFYIKDDIGNPRELLEYTLEYYKETYSLGDELEVITSRYLDKIGLNVGTQLILRERSKNQYYDLVIEKKNKGFKASVRKRMFPVANTGAVDLDGLIDCLGKYEEELDIDRSRLAIVITPLSSPEKDLTGISYLYVASEGKMYEMQSFSETEKLDLLSTGEDAQKFIISFIDIYWTENGSMNSDWNKAIIYKN